LAGGAQELDAKADQLRWEPRARLESLHGSTFSRTVWRLYGGAKGLVMSYRWEPRAPDPVDAGGAAPPNAADVSQEVVLAAGCEDISLQGAPLPLGSFVRMKNRPAYKRMTRPAVRLRS
jgi:hypothetical protein